MRVHLVDGTFELFRCFHGAPRATAADGAEVGATRGLLATLVALLREPDVTHVAVAVDQALPPRRAREEADRRRPAPETTPPRASSRARGLQSASEASHTRAAPPADPLAAQHGLAADAVRALGLPLWPMVKRFQADDAPCASRPRRASSRWSCARPTRTWPRS